MSSPTIHDVAAKAGVSIATVSRILNGNGGFSEKTRERVMEVIEQIGYQRNETARSLKTKTSRTIAVLVPRLSASFYATMVAVIEQEARANGFMIIICHTGPDGRDSKRFANMIATHTVCGVIVLALPPSSGVDQLIYRSGLPCVFLNTMPQLYDLPFICIDHAQGMYASTRYLLEAGHRRIAIVTGDISDEMTTKPRLEGYCRALRDAGIEPDPSLQANGTFDYEGSLVAFRALLEKTRDFTAVVTCSDEAALAVIHAACQAGLRVPQDISVIGFDNSRVAQIVTPALTTVAIPYEDMVSMAFENLCAQISKSGTGKNRLIALSLVVRESSAPLITGEL